MEKLEETKIVVGLRHDEPEEEFDWPKVWLFTKPIDLSYIAYFGHVLFCYVATLFFGAQPNLLFRKIKK